MSGLGMSFGNDARNVKGPATAGVSAASVVRPPALPIGELL